MSDNIKLTRDQRGFNIVELNIAMAMAAIISVSFFAIFTTYLITITRTNASILMTNDSQNLLRSMVEEIRYGAGVRQLNTIADANAPSGGWNTSAANFVIITAVPAVKADNSYIIDPSTGAPYYNEYVYYKVGNILYKRTLANSAAVGNKSIASCSQTVSALPCPAGRPADRQLIDTLNTMVFVLYDQDNIVTADPLAARSIQITLSLQKKVFGNPLVYENKIRSTLRNKF